MAEEETATERWARWKAGQPGAGRKERAKGAETRGKTIERADKASEKADRSGSSDDHDAADSAHSSAIESLKEEASALEEAGRDVDRNDSSKSSAEYEQVLSDIRHHAGERDRHRAAAEGMNVKQWAKAKLAPERRDIAARAKVMRGIEKEQRREAGRVTPRVRG